ncbi:MAG: hypothetical protein IJA79_08760 [Desulfovibrio sp.]|nr:hypothetical protein [Desulfovibrio sp.]
MTPIAAQVAHTLPRVLSLFDRDPRSACYGIGDRQHVSWCTKDYANGTQQALAHGLARLLHDGALPPFCPPGQASRVVESAFAGLARITRSDGSLEEAFPYESSFCVTALGLHDLLWAHRLCPPDTPATRARRLAALAPLARFLLRADERHGFISNHLATAAGALYLWHAETGDAAAERCGGLLLRRILEHASPEGWFREYDGADPGYQSLCLHYLALLHVARPDLGLMPHLCRGIDFLTHFVFPDGSFGGIFGSRRTRFYYPTAAALLAESHPPAAALHAAMSASIAAMNCVTLACMDDDNLAPMFNAYACAASISVPQETGALPCAAPAPLRRFPGAGLAVYNTTAHYTVVAVGLGGAYESASKVDGSHMTDGGSLLRRGDRLWSTQCRDPQATALLSDDGLDVTCRAVRVLRRRPAPLQLLCLRLLAMTVMRVPAVSRLIKRLLAFLLMGKKSFHPVAIRRRIDMSGGRPAVTAAPVGPLPSGTVFEAQGGTSLSIHMASAGYWQRTEAQE